MKLNKKIRILLTVSLAGLTVCLLTFYIIPYPCDGPGNFAKVDFKGHGTNNLRFLLSFETPRPVAARVSFWPKSEPGEVSTTGFTGPGNAHLLSLVNLKPQTDYQFRILAGEEGDCQYKSKLYGFKSGTVPLGIPKPQWIFKEKSPIDGYLFIQKRTTPGSVYIMDAQGKVVWYEQFGRRVKLSHWTSDNTMLVLLGDETHKNSAGDEIIEMDLSGKQLLKLEFGKGDFHHIVHHEVIKGPMGNIVMLVYDVRQFDLSSVGGEKGQKVIGDALVKLDKTGKELWRWSVYDVKDPLKDPAILDKKNDWGHANAVSIDNDGNYLISFRDWNQIWKIDAGTGKVIWKFGEGGDFSMDPDDHFNGQHAIHINKDGDYMLFDNGREYGNSRALAFSLDEDKMTAKTTLKAGYPNTLFTDAMGSAYLMDNGNVLLCSPHAHTIAVSDKTGKILASSFTGLSDPYRCEYIPDLN